MKMFSSRSIIITASSVTMLFLLKAHQEEDV